jgi:glycosyltransferase involved in cell wall biosynthesis
MTDITAILNLHHEGLLAGPSIHSFEVAIAYARDRQLAVESIVVIDRGDATTKAVFENLAGRHKLLASEAGDPSHARNMGVAAASGEYIAFLDGDDLWGYPWLALAHGFCVRSPLKVIAHSEVNIIFGEDSALWWHADSEDPEFDLDYLRIGNYWDALSFAKREIFIQYPFHKNEIASGYGIEDWHWNCVTLENGIAHRPVPNTVHMKRRRPGSQLSRYMANDLVIRPTELSRYRWKPITRHRPTPGADIGSAGLCVPGRKRTPDVQPL